MDLMDQNGYEFIQKRNGPTPVYESLLLTYQLLSALEHIHSKDLIHRDVKPENCFINPSKMELKLGDFGSARNLKSDKPLTEYITTRWYRPPECLLTNGVYGTPIDVWAAGCMLFEFLTGKPMFPGKNAIDQINRIHYTLGSPEPEELAKFGPAEKLQDITFPHYKQHGIKSMLPKSIDPQIVDLLSKLLAYFPCDRISASEALCHPVFSLLNKGKKMAKKDINALRSEPSISFISIPTAINQDTDSLMFRVHDDISVLKGSRNKQMPQVFIPKYTCKNSTEKCFDYNSAKGCTYIRST